MPGAAAARMSACPCVDLLRRRATFLERGACGTAWPPSAQPPVPVRTRGLRVLAASAPAGRAPKNEVVCHDMPKKVIPFPPRKADTSRPVTQGHSQITVQIGAQRYALNIPSEALAVPPKPALATTRNRLEGLQVQTRFLRLREPARLGERIDGWRVCWIGGWDKCKVLFVVMVERVIRAPQP